MARTTRATTLLAAAGLVLIAAPARAGTVYVANELSNTVSVIDTETRAVTATICLGSDPTILGTPQPAGPCNGETQHHNPFYNGHVGTHGLWLTPDGRVLLVANRISGTIVAIDTTANAVLGYAPVGREPHLATVRPGGKEAWVAVRGESQIDVLKLDPDQLFKADRSRTERMDRVASIPTVRGPSMVSFSSDGKWAFVAAGKQNRVDKIDAESRKIVASAPVAAAFTPFGLVSPDDRELYLVHKGAQKLSILRTSDLGLIATLDVGPCANHVWFIGKLAYVTIGGPPPCAPAGKADRAGKVVIIDRMAHKVAGELTGAAFTGDPHGIWGDGRRLYIGHESGNRVTVVDVNNPDDPADDAVAGVVTGQASDLAFVKQPIDVVVKP
jgi:YVTN family beta-propeller protein